MSVGKEKKRKMRMYPLFANFNRQLRANEISERKTEVSEGN